MKMTKTEKKFGEGFSPPMVSGGFSVDELDPYKTMANLYLGMM